jgi:hypothetical protein
MSAPGPCDSSDERDTQDTSPEEPRQEHDTSDTPVRSLETRDPTRLEGTPSGRAAFMGCSSRPGRSRASPSSVHRPCSADEEQEEVEGKRGLKRGSRLIFGMIVCVGHLNRLWTLYL